MKKIKTVGRLQTATTLKNCLLCIASFRKKKENNAKYSFPKTHGVVKNNVPKASESPYNRISFLCKDQNVDEST